MPTTPTYIIFEVAPELGHIREDETFTFCGVSLAAPKVFRELPERPLYIKDCGTCLARSKKANPTIPAPAAV